MLKKDFSFGKLPLQDPAGTEVSICFPSALLISFQLDRREWTTKSTTVGSAVKEVRERSLNQIHDEYSRGSRRMTLLVLKSRGKIERNTKKPVNPTADEIHAWKKNTA